MAAPHRFSEELIAFAFVPTADLGGANNTPTWLPVAGGDRITALVQMGTSNDAITTAKLQQATDSSGTDAKDLSTAGSGSAYDYDGGTPLLADTGDKGVIEARVSQLDIDNGFVYVGLYLASSADVGADAITGVLMVHAAQDERANRAGAEVVVYPSSSN